MRAFEGLAHFAEFLERQALFQVAALDAAAEATSVVLEEKIKSVYGDASKLAELSPATQEKRTRLGYSANEPLLRTGELRDTVQSEHAGPVAAAGSDDPIAAYHEWGYVNARTGTSVPPRPAFRTGLEETMPEALAILGEAVRALK